MDNKPGRKIPANILELIGSTPTVKLQKIPSISGAAVLAKLEFFNPGGSIKDRIALAMVEDAEKKGLLKEGATIVEPTSGNTGIGLALVAVVKGYRCIIVMPETASTEKRDTVYAYGAEVVLTPKEEGMAGAIKKAQHIFADTPGAFMPAQFDNPANPEIHRRTTAQEIWDATQGNIDAFVAGVGTGGTITGVGRMLKERNPGVKIIAVEPQSSAVLSGKPAGEHKIEGIGAGFIPKVLGRDIIDEVITVSDKDAFITAQNLAQKEGLFAGISSGAACWAALKVAEELGPQKTVVVILPDGGQRYFSLWQNFSI